MMYKLSISIYSITVYRLHNYKSMSYMSTNRMNILSSIIFGGRLVEGYPDNFLFMLQAKVGVGWWLTSLISAELNIIKQLHWKKNSAKWVGKWR